MSTLSLKHKKANLVFSIAFSCSRIDEKTTYLEGWNCGMVSNYERTVWLTDKTHNAQWVTILSFMMCQCFNTIYVER